MPAQPAALTPWARGALIVLCFAAVASVSVRIHAHSWQQRSGGVPGWEASGSPVDLGGGILLPRAAAQPFAVRVETCPQPVSVDFVQASPYEPDPSLVGRPGPGDHVAYVYRGRDLGSRFITIKLNAIYLARLAYARLAMRRNPATDELALKMIIPSGCASPSADVMAVLRDAYREP